MKTTCLLANARRFQNAKSGKNFFLGGKKFFSRQKYPHSMQNHKENQKKCEKSRFSAIFHTFFDFLCDFFHF